MRQQQAYMQQPLPPIQQQAYIQPLPPIQQQEQASPIQAQEQAKEQDQTQIQIQKANEKIQKEQKPKKFLDLMLTLMNEEEENEKISEDDSKIHWKTVQERDCKAKCFL
ncbi:hypothetical protein M9Y10_045757 [Tritrichomonas musculus]|uniref:Uncharacterized protein n=1 Tax=Tritrichomonas musculus TaxID=1915356 RepID=A0ABR2JW61_9EUKA